MHSVSPTPGQTLRCQMKRNTNIPKWQSHRSHRASSFGKVPLASNRSSQQPRSKRSERIPQQTPHSNSEAPAAPGDEGPTLLDGPGTLASGLKGRLQVTRGGGHFGGGGPSITGSKLHMKLSGCFLRAYLFKVMATTPTSKDISYVHKLLIRDYMCTHRCKHVWVVLTWGHAGD